MLIIYITYFLAPELFFFFILVSATFWGFFGKDLYIQKLISLNYKPTDIVTSNSPKKAILIFLSKNKMKLLTIIDYGSGNIKSVYNAFNLISENKIKIIISSSKSDIEKSSHLVLPVGSFESCINGLKKSNLIDSILKKVNIEEKPFLGICVGMQMLASKGFENGEFLGLNWIEGNVNKIKKQTKT